MELPGLQASEHPVSGYLIRFTEVGRPAHCRGDILYAGIMSYIKKQGENWTADSISLSDSRLWIQCGQLLQGPAASTSLQYQILTSSGEPK